MVYGGVMVLAVAALGAAVNAALTQSRTESAVELPPLITLEDAPAFSLPDLRDPARTVSFDGSPERPTVINFFAAWCVPCRTELPHFAAAGRTRSAIDFIGVDVRDIRTDALALVDEFGVSYPLAVDKDRRIADRYQLPGMPTTVLVSPNGRVEAVKGAVSAEQLWLLLDRLEAA